MPSPVYWLTVPSKRCTPSARICEEAVHDPVPLLGVDLLGELHRALHVGEEDGHLLALAFEGAARGEDLLGEVLGRVGARVRSGRGRSAARDRLATRVAEFRRQRQLRAARRAIAARDWSPHSRQKREPSGFE